MLLSLKTFPGSLELKGKYYEKRTMFLKGMTSASHIVHSKKFTRILVSKTATADLSCALIKKKLMESTLIPTLIVCCNYVQCTQETTIK